MKRRYKLKKKPLIVLILIILITIFLISLLISHLKNKSYSLEYNINGYKVNENYDSNRQLYYYEITYNDYEYNFIYNSKYLKEKKLIEDISSKEENDLTCLYIESDYIESNPLCNNGKEVVYYQINRVEEEKEPANINNYEYYADVTNVYLWTYKNVSYYSKGELKDIKLFSKDIYDIPLAARINEYLLIPDYEQSYSFNKMYIVNLNTNKVETWKLKYDIAFDSTVLGYNDKSLFIVDKKNNIEYELVPHKKKMRIVGTKTKQGIIYEYGETKKVSVKEIINSNKTFKYQTNYHYSIESDGLYLTLLDSNIKTKVSNQEITSIISVKEDEIHYLVKDTLYSFNLKDGIKKLIKYDDWEFNHDNLIFIN
ncbi:MAG: hypothetical protein II625_00450 [Bacilli bacterium]|nr:hypothetical protein [Bacilli bacterium]